MIPHPEPLKYGRDGRCDMCGARGPLTEVSLPSKRHPVMICIRCYIQMRNMSSKKGFDEDDEFQEKWRAENHSFENAVSNMLAVANHLGSVEAAREQWGAAPQVWEEVTRRFNVSFNSSNYTLGPNCICGATLQWSDKKRAWYCVECPFNTFKNAERNIKYTRFLGDIPDEELRMMYKQGKISRAQMHIGIGLKMPFSAEDRPEEERMTRPQAEALATKMIGLLQPSCEFIEVCGSFRRGREDPGDLDIVVILKPRETLPKIVEDLEEEHTAVNWLGEKKTQIIVDGVKVDIRVTTERAKGAALLYFTGPAGYNIGIRRAAKSRGMKLNEYGIWTRDTNEYLGGATEEEIYAVLGKNFRPATERRAENIQEFNSAIIFPPSYKKAGPVEKAMINNVMMTELRLQEALLTLETNIKMGLISEQEALEIFMKIVG